MGRPRSRSGRTALCRPGSSLRDPIDRSGRGRVRRGRICGCHDCTHRRNECYDEGEKHQLLHSLSLPCTAGAQCTWDHLRMRPREGRPLGTHGDIHWRPISQTTRGPSIFHLVVDGPAAGGPADDPHRSAGPRTGFRRSPAGTPHQQRGAPGDRPRAIPTMDPAVTQEGEMNAGRKPSARLTSIQAHGRTAPAAGRRSPARQGEANAVRTGPPPVQRFASLGRLKR